MLPIFNLEILKEEDGVFAVGIVEDPATEQQYMLFEKDKDIQKFQIQNEEQQIITGVLMTANSLIYRSNEVFGEHYIKFSPDAIRKAMQLFFRDNHHLYANFEHDDTRYIKDVYFYESFQVDQKRGIKPPVGMDVPDGSWIATLKVEDKETWEKIKSGDFKGFSIEGLFTYTMPDEDDETLIDAVQDLLDVLEEKEIKKK